MALILKRAADLQAGGEEGMTHTIEEIQEIAEQAGIDPRLVGRAAASLQHASDDARNLWGASATYRLTRQIAGRFDTAGEAGLVATIRDHLPAGGEVRTVGRGFEWHSGPADNKTVISLSPAEHGTMLRVDTRRRGAKALPYFCAITGSAVATVAGFAVVQPLAALGIGFAATVLSLAGARTAWNRFARENRRRLEAMSDALAEQIEPTPAAERVD
jgi:hypothetical protein